MRRFPLGWAIFVFVVAMVAYGVYFRSHNDLGRLAAVQRAQNAPSRLYARLTIRYDRPPIYEETYSMQDVEGKSTYRYRVRGYDGKEITITQPPGEFYDVSFFFGRLVQDGVWDLVDKPPRPHPDAHYTLFVEQYADYRHGSRTVTFTNPHYWATTAGQKFQIDLSKQSPNDLLKLHGTAIADPHYAMIVDDFRNFGPKEFRDNVARAIARVRGR